MSRIFVKIPGISGTYKTPPYAGWLEVESLQFGAGVSRSEHMNTGVGNGGVRPTPSAVQDVTFSRYLDEASPKLFHAAATGQEFDYAVAEISGNGRTRVEFSGVYVSAYSTSSSGGDGAMESFTLDFAKAEVTPGLTGP